MCTTMNMYSNCILSVYTCDTPTARPGIFFYHISPPHSHAPSTFLGVWTRVWILRLFDSHDDNMLSLKSPLSAKPWFPGHPQSLPECGGVSFGRKRGTHPLSVPGDD